MTSTSQIAPLGRARTSTQERAGFSVKYRAYTALKAAKSLMSVRKHSVLTAFSGLVPAASSMATRFFITCSACSSIVVPAISPVAGSRAICPDV